MAAKRIKELRDEEETNATMADRLTNMPESIQIRILSFLDTRLAVQTSVLSKSWVSLWTYVQILNFRSYSFKTLDDFNKFVSNALSLRKPVKLDKLTFICRDPPCFKILKKVLAYAFSHGVKELEAEITGSRSCEQWSIWLHTSSDSLTSLTLRSDDNCMSCPFSKPRSGSFQNLTSLHLEGVSISNLDSFSGFPALEKLRLVVCRVDPKRNVVNVYALQLSKLIIINYKQNVKCIELKTPKLRHFEYYGKNFPILTTHLGDGLPVLDSVFIGYKGVCALNQKKIMFDDLLMLFSALHNVRSLTVVSSIVHLLALFPEELVNECSPFRDLKCLKVDLRYRCIDQQFFDCPCRWLSDFIDNRLPGVNAYLLHKSRDAKFTIIHPERSQDARTCVCVQSNAIKHA